MKRMFKNKLKLLLKKKIVYQYDEIIVLGLGYKGMLYFIGIDRNKLKKKIFG